MDITTKEPEEEVRAPTSTIVTKNDDYLKKSMDESAPSDISANDLGYFETSRNFFSQSSVKKWARRIT